MALKIVSSTRNYLLVYAGPAPCSESLLGCAYINSTWHCILFILLYSCVIVYAENGKTLDNLLMSFMGNANYRLR